jgi:hypothetical protein
MTYINLVHVDTLSCEAILRKAPNDELIIISQCGGLKEPSIDNRVYIFRSVDQGRSWSKPSLVYPDDGMAVYCTEVTVIANDIFAFLTIHNGFFLDFHNVVMKSSDNGHSWEETELFPNLPGFVFVRGALKLRNGDIVFPYQQYLVSETENNDLAKNKKYIWNSNIETVTNGIYIKRRAEDDIVFGGEVKVQLWKDSKKLWQWTEPTLAELSNGTLVMLLRINKTGYLYRSDSTDGGLTWSDIKRTNLKNPGNKPKLIMLPDNNIALLNTFNDGDKYIDRNPLSLWISCDDMNTWEYKEELVNFPGWLSYPDGIVNKGDKIQFAFEFNRQDIYFVEHIYGRNDTDG